MDADLLNKYHKQRLKLCKRCVYRRRRRRSGIYCKVTGLPPDFFFFCPDFKAHKQRHYKNEYSGESVLFFFISAVVMIISLFIFLISNWGNPDLIFTLVVIANVIYFFLQIIKKLFSPPEIYVYTQLAFFVFNKKNPVEDEKIIVKQQIIRLFDKRYISYFNKNFKKFNEIDLQKLRFKISVSSLDDKMRLQIFQKICEIYVIDNSTSFETDGVMEKVGDYLKLETEKVKRSKKIYLQLEQERLKKIREEKEEEEKRRKEEEERRNKKRQNYSRHRWNRTTRGLSLSHCLAVLGLNSGATNDEIKKTFKKLALKYHPDRFVGSSETERKKASEKFKEISQAYNYLKRIKKLS